MKNMNGRKDIVVVQLAINLLLVVALALFPSDMDTIYKINYVVDVVCVLIVVILCSSYAVKNHASIFDPIGIITFIYCFLYFVTPIYDIVTGNHTWFGYYLFSYGVEASLIALAGYISFYLFYVVFPPSFRSQPQGHKISRVVRNSINNRTIALAILVFYGFAFAANLFYLLHSGYGNIVYILTMGLLGSGGSSVDQQESIGFIAMFSYCLPTLVLLYWEYGKNKVITFVLFLLMLVMQVTRGFRFLVVQIVISFVAYFCISHRKKPKLRQLVLLFLILMIPVLFMTIFRNEVRSGSGVSISSIDIATILDAIEDAIVDNFRIYNNFYGIVHAVPQQYDFVYGRQIIIGTIVMVIPRLIWPGKISSQAGVDLDQIIGSRLANTGQAYPGLGEYYYAFGIVGVIFFMAIYGVWMRRVKEKYMSSADPLDIVTFSVLLASNLQLLIRGYTPSNFWYLVFSLLPVLMVRFIENSVLKN